MPDMNIRAAATCRNVIPGHLSRGLMAAGVGLILLMGSGCASTGGAPAEDGAAQADEPSAETPAAKGKAEKEGKTTDKGKAGQQPAQAKRTSMEPVIPGIADLDTLTDALRRYEQRSGVTLLQNERNQYKLFLGATPYRFTISDKTGGCLYEVIVPEPETGSSSSSSGLPIQVEPGPCRVQNPMGEAEVKQRVASLAETVVYPALVKEIEGSTRANGCSDRAFLHRVLQFPFALDGEGAVLERFLSTVSDRVLDPYDLTFGDVLFFTPTGARAPVIGIYAGYGLLAVNAPCERASVRPIEPGASYRVYRPFIGYASAAYRLRKEEFFRKSVVRTP